MATPTLPESCTEADKAKVGPGIGIFVELDPDGAAGVFTPIGCCITQAQQPALSRSSNVDETCISIEDCDNLEEALCDEVPNTSPGDMEESELQFTTNHVPGSDRTCWFENMQKCGTKLRFMACHPNGAKQIFECAWVRSYTPQSQDANTASQKADVVLSLCGPWIWQ